MKRVLETVLKNGARPAEPGEFTKRAFLNGRIDLSRAEAVMDVIQAKNEYALKNSLSQLKGSVQKKLKSLRQSILYEIARIESALDDPEHMSLENYPEELGAKNKEWLAEIEKLIDSSENGKILKEGIQTVILGKPNAGKSSLLNILSGEEKSHCHGNCRNHQGHSGRNRKHSRHYPAAHGYGRNPQHRGRSGKNRCFKGKGICEKCRFDYLCD